MLTQQQNELPSVSRLETRAENTEMHEYMLESPAALESGPEIRRLTRAEKLEVIRRNISRVIPDGSVDAFLDAHADELERIDCLRHPNGKNILIFNDQLYMLPKGSGFKEKYERAIMQNKPLTNTLPALLSTLIKSDNTSSVVMEYFYPEVKENTARFPVLGQYTYKKYIKGYIPVIYFRIVEEMCAKYGRTVETVDIANKPLYILELALRRYIPLGAMALISRISERNQTGMFDREHLHGYERYLIDIEDARRVYAAAGIKQIAEESADTGDILVLYPPAHGMRIANYLLDSTPQDRLSRRIKERLYQLFAGLDRQIRTYIYNPEADAWMKTSRPMTLKR